MPEHLSVELKIRAEPLKKSTVLRGSEVPLGDLYRIRDEGTHPSFTTPRFSECRAGEVSLFNLRRSPCLEKSTQSGLGKWLVTVSKPTHLLSKLRPYHSGVL